MVLLTTFTFRFLNNWISPRGVCLQRQSISTKTRLRKNSFIGGGIIWKKICWKWFKKTVFLKNWTCWYKRDPPPWSLSNRPPLRRAPVMPWGLWSESPDCPSDTGPLIKPPSAPESPGAAWGLWGESPESLLRRRSTDCHSTTRYLPLKTQTEATWHTPNSQT